MAINIGKVTIGNLWRSGTEVLNLLAGHFNRYPKMGAQDVYALIYQGAMGAAYFNAGDEIFEEQLLDEFAAVQPNEGIPVWETIRPDGELVRLHLAALKARGGDPHKLSTLCIWTATVFKGDKQDLKDGWETFERLIAEKRMGKYSGDAVAALTRWLKANNYPPARHTNPFREAYDPHYRLLKREFLQFLLD